MIRTMWVITCGLVALGILILIVWVAGQLNARSEFKEKCESSGNVYVKIYADADICIAKDAVIEVQK